MHHHYAQYGAMLECIEWMGQSIATSEIFFRCTWVSVKVCFEILLVIDEID